MMVVSFVLAWCSLMMAAVARVVVGARRLRVTGVVLMPHVCSFLMWGYAITAASIKAIATNDDGISGIQNQGEGEVRSAQVSGSSSYESGGQL